MARNLTGRPNTRDYYLGRGIIYLAILDEDQLPGPWRDLGNAPAFTATLTSEELLHQASRTGLKVTDKRITLSQDIGLAFSVDELSAENQALFFGGTVTSVTNPAVAGVGTMMAPIEITDDATLGRWYDLRTVYTGAGVPTSFSATSVPKIRRTSGTPMDLVIDTDYLINHETGQVFLKTDAVNVAATDTVAWYSAADASAPANIERVQALDAGVQTYALKFVAENPASDSEKTVYEFYSVSISADGDLALIGEEFAQANFTGAAQRNSNVNIEATLNIWNPER